jgi:TolB-like protein/Flp pilus assembly protein TadD
MSADRENEYFSDGLSEELLNLLAKIPELQVAARTSAFSFKGADISIPEIANKLNVAHVLEGSVRKSGDDIRITAQLIKASDGYHLWSETWDRKLTDVFAIQDEIAAAVVDVLKVTLLGETPHSRVTDPRAYELYLRAKTIDNARTREAYEEGIRLLDEALAIDPEYAEAWVELSTLITNQTGSGYLDWDDGFGRAKSAASRALEIDPENARAMANIGWVAMYRDRDYAEATRLISAARRLEPGNASVLNAYAVLNGHFGRTQTARSIYLEALSIDPLAMSILANTAGVNFALRRFDDMEEMIVRMREIGADSLYADIYEGWRAYGMGNAELALDLWSGIDDLNSVWAQAFPLYDLGQDEEVLKAIETLKNAGSRSVQVASIYAYMGDADNAFAWLERGYEDGDDDLVEIRQYTAFEPVEDDPRWELMLDKIGISDANANRIGL